MAQHPRVQEFEEAKQFAQVVLDGCSAECEPMISLEQSGGFGGSGLGILDGLSLVQDHVVKMRLGQESRVPAQSSVSGNHQIVVVEGSGVLVSPQSRVVENTEFRGKASRLLLPVVDNGSGDNYQRNPWARSSEGLLTVGSVSLEQTAALEQSQNLNRLTQAHIVGKTATKAELLQKRHPSQALSLVDSESTGKAGGLEYGPDPFEVQQLIPGLLENLIEGGFRLGREQGVDQHHLAARETKAFLLGDTQVTQNSVPVQPFLGQDTEASIAQRNEVFAPPQCFKQLWQGDLLVPELHVSVHFEPVDIRLDLDTERAGASVETTLGLYLPTFSG